MAARQRGAEARRPLRRPSDLGSPGRPGAGGRTAWSAVNLFRSIKILRQASASTSPIECLLVEAPLSPEQQYWIIQPLLRAGLGLDEIRDLVFRLGFEAVVTEGASAVVGMHDVVSDQPAEIRAAWNEMIGRMIALRPSGGHGHGETGPSSPDDDPDA